MSSHIWTCIAGVFSHWIAVVTGSAVSLVILIKEKATDKPVRWKTILAVFVLGFLVSLFFAWQDQYTSAEWRGTEVFRLSGLVQGKDEELKTLQNELIQKDRPIFLQYTTDPELAKMLNRQNQELVKLKTELPSPKKKALQLSNDMLTFSANVNKTEPRLPMTVERQTEEEWKARMNQFNQAYLQWMHSVAGDYERQFAVRIVSLEDDIKTAGLPDNIAGCQYSNGNDFEIQRCGALIGVLADKLPQ